MIIEKTSASYLKLVTH